MRSSPSPRRERRRSYSLLLERLEGRVVPSFLPARSFPVGGSPAAVAVGDFNGDAVSDLAVANSGSVSVLLGQGDGSFAAATDYSTGRNSVSVSARDFTNDGALDLVTVNRFDSVSFLRGHGDGTFEPATHAAAPGPWHGVAGEFDSDGRLDLALAAGGQVLWLPGNGDGTFGEGRPILPFFAFALYVETGDFNGDRVPDLAVVNSLAPFLSVFLGNGDGTFQAAPPAQSGSIAQASVSVGDFNADGRQDLVTANFNDNSVSVLSGNGDGTFQAPVFLPMPARADQVGVGDFNNDGLADLAVASSTVVVRLSNGDGTFADGGNYAAGQGFRYAAVGDWDRDGWTDLAVANGDSSDVSILLNDGYWGGPVVYFYIYPDSAAVTAGQPFDVYVLPLNADFEIVTTYTGLIFFWSTDPLATIPVYHQFQLSDRGIASFFGGVTFRTPGLQELFVLDWPAIQVFGYAAFEVGEAGPSPGGERPGSNEESVLDAFAAEALHGRPAFAAPPRGGKVAAALGAPEPGPAAADRERPEPVAATIRAAAVPPRVRDHVFATLVGERARWEWQPAGLCE